MAKSPSQKREDEVLLRMLKTSPKPHAGMKAKTAPGYPENPQYPDAPPPLKS